MCVSRKSDVQPPHPISLKSRTPSAFSSHACTQSNTLQVLVRVSDSTVRLLRIKLPLRLFDVRNKLSNFVYSIGYVGLDEPPLRYFTVVHYNELARAILLTTMHRCDFIGRTPLCPSYFDDDDDYYNQDDLAHPSGTHLDDDFDPLSENPWCRPANTTCVITAGFMKGLAPSDPFSYPYQGSDTVMSCDPNAESGPQACQNEVIRNR